MFAPVLEDLPAPATPVGTRVYAIGDIHGRDDLLVQLLGQIEADDARRPAAATQLVLLGDLVDRGADSAAVVARARRLAQGDNVRFLKGNHEEVFIQAARGDALATRFFIRIGGRETMLSYGLGQADYDAMTMHALTDWMLQNVPRDDIDFLDGFEDMIEIGDYLFVHAGIRPGIALAAQKVSDLRWIREEFLDHDGSHGRIVIHGHTITDDVDECTNRIGIDTGAFRSGKLTAIGMEGSQRWYLST